MDDFTRDSAYPDHPAPEWEPAPPASKSHLLIALFPDAAVQAAIEAHRKGWLWPEGHYFPRNDRMHLTLHCLADQTSPVEQRLREVLAQIPVQPMELVLDSSRTWDHIAVVQPAEHAGLRALQQHIGHAVRQLGIPTDRRRFTPHITIAREAASAAYPMRMPPIIWRATKFLLIRSFTKPFFKHEVLASYEAKENAYV